MNDEEIRDRIAQLVREERLTREAMVSGRLRQDLWRERLHALTVQIDQYWDLLRQRQGHRDAGRDPDQASLRPAEVVEKYEQQRRQPREPFHSERMCLILNLS